MKEYLSHYGTGHHTAVLCFSDYLAFGIKRAIREAGYRIPEDFSLTGFGDSSIGEYMEPALTTVEWDPLDCGYAAAKLLHERMRQKKDTEKSFILYRIAGRDRKRNTKTERELQKTAGELRKTEGEKRKVAYIYDNGKFTEYQIKNREEAASPIVWNGTRMAGYAISVM